MTNLMGIIVSAIAVLAISFVSDKFIFKRTFDPKATLLNVVTVVIVLGVAGLISKRAGQGSGLESIPQRIASK